MNQQKHWLDEVPYGGYAKGPLYVGQDAYGYPTVTTMQPGGQIDGTHIDHTRSTAVAVGLTLLGIVLTGGVGALAGWILGGSRGTALMGALFGISAGPTITKAVMCARDGGP